MYNQYFKLMQLHANRVSHLSRETLKEVTQRHQHLHCRSYSYSVNGLRNSRPFLIKQKSKKKFKKTPFIWVSMYIQHESTNWGHNLNVSYWRRNRHFTWSSEPREGLAVYRAKRQCLHFSDILRSWVLVRPHESSPLPPALQSSALLTEQILPRLKCHRNAICFKSTMSNWSEIPWISKRKQMMQI